MPSRAWLPPAVMVKRVAYELAEEVIANNGYVDEKLLASRMESTTGIRPAMMILPGGSFEVRSFTQIDENRDTLEEDEEMIDYRRDLRRMDDDELKNEQENAKPDPIKVAAVANEFIARKSEIYSSFVSMLHGLSDIVCGQKISAIIAGGNKNSFLKSITKEKDEEAEKQAKEQRIKEWNEIHPDILIPEEDDDDEIDDNEEDDDHPEPEHWEYDSGDADNPWYLTWDGDNDLSIISLIFPSKKAGLEYLVPILGVPVSENENGVRWNFDIEKASSTKIAKLFTSWYFGCGAPSSPSLVRVKYGQPLCEFNLD